jgi:hypothetical protein
MRPAYNFINAQQLLIKPSERLRFILLFIIASEICQIASYWLFVQLNFSEPWQQIATTGISGAILGVIQWLILRKYIPDWRWILAVAINSALYALVQIAISRGLPWNSSNPLVPWPVVISISALGASVVTLIYSCLQWYIIQPYVKRVRWWIFLIFLAFLIALGVSGLHYFITSSLMGSTSNPWSRAFFSLIHKFTRYLTPILMSTAIAFGFCCLKQKPAQEHPISESRLATSTDISDYWQLKKLREILYLNISKRWQTELSPDSPPLRYLIGVDQGHTPMVYEAMNPVSLELVDQTPLPELFVPQSQTSLKDSVPTALAKFQVTFTPPASVNVVSVRGIPLFWLGMMVFAMVLGLSILSVLLEYLTGWQFF